MDDFAFPSLLHSFQCSLVKVFRYIIPAPEDRIPLTWTTAWIQAVCLVPVIYMAYLARRPGTYVVRLAVLPFAAYFILHAMYGYAITSPQVHLLDRGRSQFLMAMLSKAIDFGLQPSGMLKKGEIEPGVYRADYKPPPPSPLFGRPLLRVPSWLSDTIHLLLSIRGIDYQFSEGVHLPKPTRPQSPTSAFFIATLSSLFTNLLVIDLLESSGRQLFPSVARPGAGTIFDPSLPVYPIPWRYIASTTITTQTAFIFEAGLKAIYDVLTLIGVGLCGQQATDWPPIMDHPWSSESLHMFWGRGWHQVLRRTLILLGAYPAQLITTHGLSFLGVEGKVRKRVGEIAMLFGVFIASGLFHEISLHSLGLGFDHWGWIFFTIQGPLLVIERVWKKVTGRPVRGWWGTLWVALVLLVGPQMLFDSWYARGLAASTIIPPGISPARQVIFPLVKGILGWVGMEGVIREI